MEFYVRTSASAHERKYQHRTVVIDAPTGEDAENAAIALHRDWMMRGTDGAEFAATVGIAEIWEVVDGGVQLRLYSNQLRPGDMVYPSEVEVLERPRPAGDGPGRVIVVTTGDGDSREPTERRWKTTNRLVVFRPVKDLPHF